MSKVLRARTTGEVITPAPRDVWLDVLKRDPTALVSQTPAWLDCINAIDGSCDASRLYLRNTGLRLVVPMVRSRPLLGVLSTQASFADNWGIGGLIGSGPISGEDVRAVLSDLQEVSVLRTVVRPNPLQNSFWTAGCPTNVTVSPRRAHILDLSGGFSRVWAERFSSNARRLVRKAERSGLEVQHDTTGRLIPVFDVLLRQSINRWAEQQHEPRVLAQWRGQRRDPRYKFEEMARRLGDAFNLWVAFRSGEPAAAILVLQGVNANYTRGVMNKHLVGPTGANYLLHRLAIEDACQSGCNSYHMGETGESSSLAEFKAEFGALSFRYATYSVERFPVTRTTVFAKKIIKMMIGFRDVAQT